MRGRCGSRHSATHVRRGRRRIERRFNGWSAPKRRSGGNGGRSESDCGLSRCANCARPSGRPSSHPPPLRRLKSLPLASQISHGPYIRRSATRTTTRPLSVSMTSLSTPSLPSFSPPPQMTTRVRTCRDSRKDRRERLRGAMLPFHPHKFEGRVIPRVRADERDVV